MSRWKLYRCGIRLIHATSSELPSKVETKAQRALSALADCCLGARAAESGAQSSSTFGTPSVDDRSTATRCHSRAKSVRSFALQFTGLKCTFHGCYRSKCRQITGLCPHLTSSQKGCGIYLVYAVISTFSVRYHRSGPGQQTTRQPPRQWRGSRLACRIRDRSVLWATDAAKC